jgi:hypothetical protein
MVSSLDASIMAKHASPLATGRIALDQLARRPLSHALVACLVAATAAVLSPAAAAQSAISISQTGTTGADQSGAAGGPTSDISSLASGYTYTGIYLSNVGGTGGTGYPSSGTTGPGGMGGASGQINLTLDNGDVASNNVAAAGNPNAAVWLRSVGGEGGSAGKMSSSSGYPGTPGAGGAAGDASFNQQWNVSSSSGWNNGVAGTTAVLVQSIGGAAAEPLASDGASGPGKITGTYGNSGGAAGAVNYNLELGYVLSQGSGVMLQSVGGRGGDGTSAYSDIGQGTGGDGGTGGNGGAVVATIGASDNSYPLASNITAVGAPTAATGSVVVVDKAGNTAQAADVAAGVLAQSIGGLGGAGGEGDGSSGASGPGGAAGNAGDVNVAVQYANISTTGFAAAGVIAQSVGGAGGDGSGAAGIFYKGGGNGGNGGAAGSVDVQLGYSSNTTWPSQVVSTTGADSIGVIAQSIGGGGGVGGAVSAGSLLAGVAIGGSGENGGAAGTVTLLNGIQGSGSSSTLAGDIISTRGQNSSGLVAQSIGGGGGTGGSAQNTNLGAFSYTVGGNGGTGGSAGAPGVLQVGVDNLGIVNTVGGHAKGIVAQAVGGGGGDGGAAMAQSASDMLDVQVAVGGKGGAGGSSGDVGSTNDGQLLTNGSDAYGMLAQSISGGGGSGGSSVSDVLQLPGADAVPQITVNTSVGGSGGDGSPSGNVTAVNNDTIMTAGAASHGIMAQSITNGGGVGGDASALTVVAATGPTLTATVSVGGAGGGAAQAGNVTVGNSANAMIWTLGDSADAVFAQSIGGGGGAGGTAKETTKFLGNSDSPKATLEMHLGGTGGNGSDGGTVTATNAGNLLTIGDNSNGIFAQSIGGGGGRSTGGKENGSAGDYKETVTITGTSGVAGNGGAVNVTNTGNILTYGGDSAGILAQSVGGGGGKAGSGSTANLPATGITLSKYLAASAALEGHVSTYGGVEAFVPGGSVATLFTLRAWAVDYLAYAAKNANVTPDDTNGVVDATLNVGGGTDGDQGDPTMGNGGAVTVTNNSTIETNGPASSGIFAQSVGAGGGQGGITAANQLQITGGNTANITVNLGSHTYNSGAGGNVSVSNTSQIATQGDVSYGMFAQSVGAGGGETVTTASDYAASGSKPIQINLATGVIATGAGGDVTANNSGSIVTKGNDAAGIVAQSVGGSGGTAVVMQTGANAAGQAIGVTNPLLDSSGSDNSIVVGSSEAGDERQAIACSPIGSSDGYNTCGNGGNATVTTASGSTVSTSGRDAHGIVAQSIGGGGGWIVGLTEANGSNPFDTPIMGGNGGNISLTLAGSIATTGAGAYGVLAQTIGGGGILGGDLANAGNAGRLPSSLYGGESTFRKGDGGNITIANTGTISTTGANAHAIFAQSVGGGGGVWATANTDPSQVGNLMIGSAGGQGSSGTIQIDNSGAVSATGNGSSAVYVDSDSGNATSYVTVTNNAGAAITGNASAAAINLMGPNENGDGTINNAGAIANDHGVAINAQTFAVVNNQATGSIMGDVVLPASGGTLINDGYWGTNTSSTVENVTNNGVLDIGGANGGSTTATSYLNSLLTSNGTIDAHVDFYGNTAGYLWVNHSVTFGANSTILIDPTTLKPGTSVPIIGAGGFYGSNPSVTDPGGNYLYNYSLSWSTQNVSVQANGASHFASTAAGATTNANLLQTAGYLDSNWNANANQSLSQTYARLASVGNATQYVSALQSMTNEGASAASVSHVVTSNAFVERMNSCPRFDGDMLQQEHDCAWGRVISNSTDRDVASDSMGYHQSGQVFQLGGQKEVAEDWFVGASVSSDHTSLNATATEGSVSGQGWTAGLIAKRQMGTWLVSTAIEGGEMTYKSTRTAQFQDLGGTARGKFDVTHWGLHSRISDQIVFNSWYLKPYVDLHATRINSDGYTEQGGGSFDLKVAGSNTNVLAASPMLEAGTKFDFGKDSTLQVYAGVGGAFYNQGNLSANMQLADQPGPVYFNQSSTLPKERFKTTAGLDLKTGANWDIRLEYSGEFANHLESDTGALKVTYKF